MGVAHRKAVVSNGYHIDCVIDPGTYRTYVDDCRQAAHAEALCSNTGDPVQVIGDAKIGHEGSSAASSANTNPDAKAACNPLVAIVDAAAPIKRVYKMAVLYGSETDHVHNTHTLQPPMQLKTRQLRAAGWAVVVVPHYEWMPLPAPPRHQPPSSTDNKVREALLLRVHACASSFACHRST